MNMSSSSTTNDSNNDNTGVKTSKSLLLSTLQSLSLDGPTRLILASQSPRRREILDMMGLDGRYVVQPSPLDEQVLQTELKSSGVTPEVYARILAESKAECLTKVLYDNNDDKNGKTTYIIGSDTIVDLDGSILEKPNDSSEAKQMLNQLSGSWHKVHTGVAIYCLTQQEEDQTKTSMKLARSFTDTALVKFASLQDEDIVAYVETGEPMDKAGSYGIQGMGGQFVERMEGDFFTVMGLPMHRLSNELAKVLLE